jgi:hypothetical protein
VTTPKPPESKPVATPSPEAKETPDEAHAKMGGEAFPIPELKAYHDILHPVWHEAVPAKNWKDVCTAAPKLADAGVVLKNLKLPPEYKDRSRQFRDAATALSDDGEDLRDNCDPGKGDEVEQRTAKLHTAFEQTVDTLR